MDSTKETSDATSSHAKSSLESHRKRAAMLTELCQVSKQTLQERVESFKNGKTTLSKKDINLVARALAKGEKISPEGTISLVGDPRRWGGMSGEGCSTDSVASDFTNKIRTIDIRNAYVKMKNDYAYHMSDTDKSEFEKVSKDMISKFEHNKFKYCKKISQLKEHRNPILKDFATEIIAIAYGRIKAQNEIRNTE